MKQLAITLQRYREVRREVLLGKAARCRRSLAQAEAGRREAQGQHQQALGWRREVDSANPDTILRPEALNATLPACEALIGRRAAQLAAASEQRQSAAQQLAQAQAAVHAQERALLRGEQLGVLLARAEQRAASFEESLGEDDLASARAWQR